MAMRLGLLPLNSLASDYAQLVSETSRLRHSGIHFPSSHGLRVLSRRYLSLTSASPARNGKPLKAGPRPRATFSDIDPITEGTVTEHVAEPASSKCPLSGTRQAASAASVSTAESRPKSNPVLDLLRVYSSKGAEDSFISKKRSHVFDGVDPAAIPKALLPIQALIGIGVLISATLSFFFPATVSLALSAALILPPLLSAFLRSTSILPDEERGLIQKGGMTDTMEGEFCVFILGARSNDPLRFTSDYSYVGLKFTEMIAELERQPASTGYLGGDTYVTSNPMRSSHATAITYWRSYDHLLRYTHDSSLAHASPMRELAEMKFGDKPDVGIWHEVYVVKEGQHESIYINCPPLGLGAASGLRPAKGPLSNSKGRMKATANL